MTTLIQEAEITRPVPTRLKSNVLDHATVVENARFGFRNEAGLWPSYNCLDTLIPTAMCPEPLLGETGGFKEFSVAPWVQGFSFAVYGAVQCKAVGLDKADQEAEVKRVFALNEGKGVEAALLATRFVAFDSGSDPNRIQWADPVDVGADNMPLLAALAALEGYAAATYAGEPTIHMPRSAALILSALGAIKTDGEAFYTKTGAKVAAGGGYDTDQPATGSYDLYATGEVYVERSQQVDVQVITLPGDGSGIGSGENGLSDNTVVALAERAYRVGVDCFVAKATGTVAAVAGGGFGI